MVGLVNKIKDNIPSYLFSVFTLGVQEPKNSFHNRITIVTNVMGVWGICTVVLIGLTLESENVSFSIYGVSYFILISLCSLILVFNHLKKYRLARLIGCFTLIFCGWQASMLFGKTFNGHYIFFAALIYPFLALFKESRQLTWSMSILSFFSLLMSDWLNHNGLFPITRLNSADYPVDILFMDTFFISTFLIIILYLERRNASQYETELETLNKNLEKIVTKRTNLLFQAKEESFHTSIMKAQFVANTSHELRIPIQGIVGFTELIKMNLNKMNREKLSSDEKKSYDRIEKNIQSLESSSERLCNLIERLLTLAKAEDTGLVAQPTHFNVQDIINKCKAELEYRFKEKNMQLKVHSERGMYRCYSDATLVQQVLGNLIENAMNYGTPGTFIDIQLTDEDKILSISVTNKGIGIDPKETETIFHAFVQGSRTDSRTGGTGIGLSLCRKYAKTLNGDLQLVDIKPESTTFKLSFPKQLEKGSQTA